MIENLRTQLGGFTNDPSSVVYRFGWLNQYTNTLYYNAPILLFGLSLSIFIGWLMEWSVRKTVHKLLFIFLFLQANNS